MEWGYQCAWLWIIDRLGLTSYPRLDEGVEADDSIQNDDSVSDVLQNRIDGLGNEICEGLRKLHCRAVREGVRNETNHTMLKQRH